MYELNFSGEYAAIPEHMQQAMIRYVLDGRRPGDFLTSVICNDLRNAVGRADETNLSLLKTYVQWFYNIAPGACWGSAERMLKWMESVRNRPMMTVAASEQSFLEAKEPA